MKIAAIETFVVSLPVRRPHTWAGNFSPPGRGYVVLKLTLEDGTIGWGETQALKDWGGEYNTRSGESHETVKTVVHGSTRLVLPVSSVNHRSCKIICEETTIQLQSIYNTALVSLGKSIRRTILIGGAPCFTNASWNSFS